MPIPLNKDYTSTWLPLPSSAIVAWIPMPWSRFGRS